MNPFLQSKYPEKYMPLYVATEIIGTENTMENKREEAKWSMLLDILPLHTRNYDQASSSSKVDLKYNK